MSTANQNRLFANATVVIIFLLTGCGSIQPGGNSHGPNASLASSQGNSTGDPSQDPVANLVLGQVDFTSNPANAGAAMPNSIGLNDPGGVAIDKSVTPNRVYVADFSNNRVLGWADASALTNGSPADLVIGQPNFSVDVCNVGGEINASTLCGPKQLAVDGAGNLYVADRGNSRVLAYFTPFTATAVLGSGDTVADWVIGQPALTSGGCSNPSFSSAGASSLCDPFGVAVDGAGNVYVADMANNRVLEYDTPLGGCSTCDNVADRVFGQPGFTTRAAGRGATGLDQPNNVAVDGGGNLYVTDFQNQRVLEFNNPLGSCSTCDTVADRVFGQPDFFMTLVNAGGGVINPSASSLSYPAGIAVDQLGDVYITERGNSRVLEYFTPLVTDVVGDVVFGQPDFATNGCNRTGVTAKTLCLAYDVATDDGGNVWVSDFANNRVLRYGNPGLPPPPPPPPPTDEVTIPSASFHFEEIKAPNCPLQYEVESSFEKIPGDPTSGDGGHTTDDIDPSSVIAMMTFPGGFMTYGVVDGKEDYSTTPPGDYAKEFEVIFDCSTMTAHVFTDQDVTIHVSGTLSDGHTFSGTGVIKTHP